MGLLKRKIAGVGPAILLTWLRKRNKHAPGSDVYIVSDYSQKSKLVPMR
jgi:hypothetical protein